MRIITREEALEMISRGETKNLWVGSTKPRLGKIIMKPIMESNVLSIVVTDSIIIDISE